MAMFSQKILSKLKAIVGMKLREYLVPHRTSRRAVDKRDEANVPFFVVFACEILFCHRNLAVMLHSRASLSIHLLGLNVGP